jgi:hypothetical protein
MAQFPSGYQTRLDLIAAPSLGRMIQLQKLGIIDIWPKSYWSPSMMISVPKDYLEQRANVGMRELAPISDYDGVSRTMQQRALGSVNLKCLSTRFDLKLDASDFVNLLNYTDLTVQEMGAAEVARQVKAGTTRMMNTRVALLTLAIFAQNIYADKNGTILPTSANAIYNRSYNIPAGNLGQLNILGGGNVISAGWQTSTTVIQTMLLNIKVQSVALTGYFPTQAVYGVNVPQYITQNAALDQYLARDIMNSGAFNPTFVQLGDLSTRQLLGYYWYPGYMGQYQIGADYPGSTPSPYSSSVPYSGNTAYPNNPAGQPQYVQMVGGDQCAFLPDPSQVPWLSHVEGSYPIPNNYEAQVFSPEGDAPSLKDFLSMRKGMWCFAQINRGIPTGVTFFFGDTYIPNIELPQTVFCATVAY